LFFVSIPCFASIDNDYNALKEVLNVKSLNIEIKNNLVVKSDKEGCNKKILNRFRFCVKNTSTSVLNSYTENSTKLIDGERVVRLDTVTSPRIFYSYCKIYKKICENLSSKEYHLQYKEIIKNIVSHTPKDAEVINKEKRFKALKALSLKKQLITHLARDVNWIEIDDYWSGIEIIMDIKENRVKMYHLVSEERYIVVVSHNE